jgi:hypothetical protein
MMKIEPVWSHSDGKWICGPGDNREKDLDLYYKDAKYDTPEWKEMKSAQEALEDVLQEEANGLQPPVRCLSDVGAVQCSCQACIDMCKPGHTNPGWFRVGQAEKAAEFLKMTLDDFFWKYLVVEYWASFPQDMDVLAPRRNHQDGVRAGYGDNYHGGTCALHDSSTGCKLPSSLRPLECAAAIGCEKDKYWWQRERYSIRENIALEWIKEKPSALVERLSDKFWGKRR